VSNSPSNATGQLQAMRRSLTLLLASVTAVGLVLLALLATLIDANLRAEEAVTRRQGLASRLAAYVYPEDDSGVWNVDGILDDSASAASDAVVVVDRAGNVLYSSTDVRDFADLADAGIADDDETGTSGTMIVAGERRQASAAPYWDFDETAGAVLVSATSESSGHYLRNVVWFAAVGLTALAAMGAWVVAGRVVSPVGDALAREERFLATAAHDIRTPMGRVRALSESALRTSQAIGPQSDGSIRNLREELRRLVLVATEASDSANDLLLAGRIDANQFGLRLEPVRLDELVAGFEESIPNLAVDVDEPVCVSGDSLMLKHVIANVLHNAQQHGRSADGDSLIEVSVRAHGGYGVVVVSDNGPGLGQRDGAALFERYADGERQRTGGGGGLGLWIVKSVITEHQGTVSAANRALGPGTTIEFRLPLVP